MDSTQNNSSLCFWEKFWLTVVILTILLVTLIGMTNSKSLNPKALLFAGLSVPSILMMFQYRALRKTKILTAWTIIALIMLVEFFWLRHFQILLPSHYNAANSFKTPICFLLLFMFFRKLANKYFDTELIIPQKYWNYSYQEKRKTNTLDLISFFSYWVVIILLSIY
jgi:hypothetical protein